MCELLWYYSIILAVIFVCFALLRDSTSGKKRRKKVNNFQAFILSVDSTPFEYHYFFISENKDAASVGVSYGIFHSFCEILLYLHVQIESSKIWMLAAPQYAKQLSSSCCVILFYNFIIIIIILHCPVWRQFLFF